MNPIVPVPIDYNLIRKTFSNEIQRVTSTITVLEEATIQGAPRPQLPYFSFKLTTPGAKSGDDSQYYVANTTFGRGGIRKMTISFHCYAQEQETAYNLMALWQGSLELFQTQANLKAAGVAVWLIGNVADLSQLLNTGYEGRSQMDVQFGVASNLTENLGEIDTAEITGTVDTLQGTVEVFVTAPSQS